MILHLNFLNKIYLDQKDIRNYMHISPLPPSPEISTMCPLSHSYSTLKITRWIEQLTLREMYRRFKILFVEITIFDSVSWYECKNSFLIYPEKTLTLWVLFLSNIELGELLMVFGM